MKKIELNNKGFTTADVVIAVIILVLFVSIITTSFYNYYISTQSKNRRTIATNAIIDVIEKIETMNYDDVNRETVNKVIDSYVQDGTIQTGYTITADLQKYNETAGNEDKKDLIKILSVKAQYTINDKQENIEIKTLITK